MPPRRDNSEKCNDKNAVANVNASFVLKKDHKFWKFLYFHWTLKEFLLFSFFLRNYLNILFFLLLFVPGVSERNSIIMKNDLGLVPKKLHFIHINSINFARKIILGIHDVQYLIGSCQ